MKKLGRQIGTALVDPAGGFAGTPRPPRNPFVLAQMAQTEQEIGGLKLFQELRRPVPGQSYPVEMSGVWLNEKKT